MRSLFIATCGLDDDNAVVSPIGITCDECDARYTIFDASQHGWNAVMCGDRFDAPENEDALDGGDIEANSFQNQPYLDNQVADRGFKIESVALTVNFPIGIYSKKHKSLDTLPNGAKISIPNDPTNGGRALILLQDKGLIKLKEGTGYKPTPLDVTENPKNLKFVEIEAAQGPRVLEILQVDFVVAAVLGDAGELQAGLDLGARGILRGRHRVRQIERLLEAPPRLDRGVARGRRLAGAHRVGKCLGGQASLPKVMGEQLGLGRDRLRKAAFESLADAFVKLEALAPQQAVVGGVLEQRVLELVGDLRQRAAAEQELRLDQLREGLL